MICRSLIFLLFWLFALIHSEGLSAQDIYEPHPGQEGKDVVWLPSPQIQVESMLSLAKVTPEDYVIDLGSGDGRTVIAAAKRGAKARGIEFDENLVKVARKNAEKEGVSNRAEFIEGDLFEADLSEATVITLFLLPEINMKLRPLLLKLKPGTRIISNTFQMEDWIPDSTYRADEDCHFWCDAYLWIVPAKAEGIWKMPQGELSVNQKFQMLSGTLRNKKKTYQISNGRVKGNQISFSIKNKRFAGIIHSGCIDGNMFSSRNNYIWQAIR